MATTALLLLSSLIRERKKMWPQFWLFTFLLQKELGISKVSTSSLFGKKLFSFSLCDTRLASSLVLEYDLQENTSSRSPPDSKSSVHLATAAGGNNWHVLFGHTAHLTHDWNPQLVRKIAKSNVLRHIKASSLSVTTFKVNPLFLLCWWTTAKCSSTCLSSNALAVLL